MQLSQETSRAAEFLREIFERGNIPKLSEPKCLRGGNSYILVVTGYGKVTRVRALELVFVPKIPGAALPVTVEFSAIKGR
jgi:hypothetical protein